MRTNLRATLPAMTAHVGLPAEPPSRVHQALQAVRALAGAGWVELTDYDRRTQTLAQLDGRSTGRAGASGERMLAALGAVAPWARDRLTWAADAPGEGAILLIEAGERDDLVHLIALGFAEPAAACRARVAEIAAPLTALVTLLLQLGGELSDLHRRQEAADTALDNLDYGVIAVRQDRTPILMNRVVKAMLAGDGPIQLHRGFVRPVEHRDAIRFHVALDSAIAAGAGTGHPREPGEAFMMLLADDRPGARGGDSTVLLIAPAHRLLTGDGAPRGAAALIYLFRPEVSDVRGLEPLCQLLGLSGAETRLVTELLVGHTVAEAAAAMRVKLETARSYLKQVFAKTGTHRQTDLVALIHRYLLTVRGRFAFRAV